MLNRMYYEVKFYLPGDTQLHTKEFDYCQDADEFIEGTGAEVFLEDWKEEPLPADQLVFVNVYYVTREYGGPEEGGWYYNQSNCVESVPVQNQYSEQMAEYMKEKYAMYAYGNIYSVLGGQEVDVAIEMEPAASETRERPHYE